MKTEFLFYVLSWIYLGGEVLVRQNTTYKEIEVIPSNETLKKQQMED